MAGMRQIKGEKSIVIGKPEIGRGQKGMSHPLMFALYYQHLSPEQFAKIYNTAGIDVAKVFDFAHYHVDEIIDDLVVMKYYPPGEDCPCESKATNKNGEQSGSGNENPDCLGRRL